MAGEIAAGWAAADEVLFGEKRLSSCVVSSRKMDLGQPKGIVVVICKPVIPRISLGIFAKIKSAMVIAHESEQAACLQ